ncbi:GTPase family protein [Rodentibacter trehalosifermentans]|uniref:GTPase family protein n=1 Tax=Rodentibacter trehalosifermentans TaxID=1908263 RepID=UPI000985579F|nr:GTPase [Rodentibacter trehalosifermentans]OOF53316.1 GTP-binding protein [Rodentibacter trehalosifermentans]
MSNSRSQINNTLDRILDNVPPEIRSDIKRKLESIIFYTPKIGVMGKSGAGKSSLINAIMGRNVCQTGGVGGCTRDIQEERISVGSREIIFMDLPGIAENTQRNDEYVQLYAKKLKDLDVLLWVIKIDDRANKDDEEFYNWLIKNYKKERILFVLSQSDKAEPSRDWNYNIYSPSNIQLNTIYKNQQRIKDTFCVSLDDIIPIACEFYNNKFDTYNIDKLVTRIIQKVPQEAKSSLLSSVAMENRTQEAKKEAKSTFRSVVDTIYDTAVEYIPVPAPVKIVLRKSKDWVVDKVEAGWNWLFG